MDMDRVPVFDILSRMPVKSLARSRCVSKLWCEYIGDPYLCTIHGERVVEEPIPIMLHKNPPEGAPRALCFHTIEPSKPDSNTDYVLKHLDLEFVPNKPPPKDTLIKVQLRGFCNGLLIILQDDGRLVTGFNVIHPLRKECYQLPDFPLELSCQLLRGSCGLGFDAATNTLKMVCILLRECVLPNNPDLVHKNLCTMVHVFGQSSSSWQEIPQVPLYLVEGEAVFSHGCLHWLPATLDRPTREVISFDVTKEEFGLINPPKTSGERHALDNLVDINGEVGLVCHTRVSMEVWLLKKKQWVLHCQLDKKRPLPSDFSISVLGSWNKDGDILIKGIFRGRYCLFVYTLKSGGVHELDIAGWEGKWLVPVNVVMYPRNLFSIRGINNTNPLSIQSKTDLKKSCCF